MPGNEIPPEKIDAIFKINKLLELEIDLPDDEGTHPEVFSSRVEDVKPGVIHVAAPYKNGYLLPVHSGDTIQIRIFHEGSLYKSSCHVRGHHAKPVAVLVISRPERLYKVQMRQWVRIALSVPVRYRMDGYPVDFYQSTTVDLSGGGFCLLTRHPIDVNTVLDIEMELPQQAIKLKALVKRCTEVTEATVKRYKIGIQYQKIAERDREKIIEYIFIKQREQIRKGR
jgi:c-di-GMP-binding flagellar brake protein YcgR